MNEEQKNEFYFKQFTSLTKRAENLSDSLDKIMLTISSGAFVLSVNFVYQTSSTRIIGYVSILECAWFFLIAAMILNILSIHLAHASIEANKIDHNEWKEKNLLDIPRSAKRQRLDRYTKWSHGISIAILVFGVALLAVFASLNINSIIMSSEKVLPDGQKTLPATSNPLPPSAVPQNKPAEVNIEPQETAAHKD